MKILNRGITTDPPSFFTSEQLRLYFADELQKIEADTHALSSDQEEQVTRYWRRYKTCVSTGWTSFYYSRTGVFDVRYVPHDLFYPEIDRVLNHPYRSVGIDDKYLYYRIFPTAKQPELICAKLGRVYLDNTNHTITLERAMKICEKEKGVVCKQPFFSCGGSGVHLLHLPQDNTVLMQLLQSCDDYIIQKRIVQSPELAKLHPASINTIRTITYLRESGEVVVLSSVVRMGVGSVSVDNISSGGCSCGIKQNGRLNDVGYTNDGQRIIRHPDGTAFSSCCVPNFVQVMGKAMELHLLLPQFALLAWDFAIDKTESPVLIEVNIGRASIDFMQLNNGPLFGEYTDEILERVYRLPVH